MRPRWIGTLLYVPVLYGLGWLLVQPLGLLTPAIPRDRLDLVGTALALLLLLVSLPLRIQRVWAERRPWRRLGVTAVPALVAQAFLRGLLKAGLLLALVTVVLLTSGQAFWHGSLSAPQLLNAMALLLGVGFAEELLFRGWLWGNWNCIWAPALPCGARLWSSAWCTPASTWVPSVPWGCWAA